MDKLKKLNVTIGNLPTAYLESMSYYECITFLVNYIENNLVPVIEELSAKVKDLEDRVEALEE